MRDLDPKLVDEALDLDSLDLPDRPRVKRIVWESIVDHLGEPALEVWVLLDDRTPISHRTWKRLSPIYRAIQAALDEAGVVPFAFIRSRTGAEHRRRRRVG